MQAAILLILLNSTPHFSDTASPEQRLARLTVVAAEQARVANMRIGGWEPRRIAAALLAIGHHESRFAEYVGAGCLVIPKGAPDCDAGRARSYYQLWRRACLKAWAQVPGSRAELREGTECAARRLIGAYYRCRADNPKNPLFGAFSGFRSACRWEGAHSRVRTFSSYLARLQ